MNVVLLYPEVYEMARFKEQRKEFPPFGVLYLAAVVEGAGHHAVIEKVSPLRTELDLSQYDAVGFSLASSATYNLMLAARRTSSFDPSALIMVGGVHCNFYPEESLRDFGAHVAAIGESEKTILDLLQRRDDKQFADVPGTLWQGGSQIHRERARPLIGDIDELPLPARHLLPQADFVMADRLAGTSTRMAHIMLSRGCPFPCSFCASSQTKIQYRSGTSARRELTHLIESYGIEGFAIADDNFIVNKRKVAAICDSIEDLQLRWSALSRVDTIDAPLMRKMRQSGCIEIKFGMESGSETLLRAMRKNTTREDIRRAVHTAVDAGIEAKVFVIHGFPGENLETTHETISLLDELSGEIARVSLFRFVPLPGSQVYDAPESYGVHGTHRQPGWDGDWSRFHIHHNDRQWWGSDEQWNEVERSYQLLRSFVEENWNPQ